MSKIFAFELNVPWTIYRKGISDLNLNKILKLLSQYFPIRKKDNHLLFQSPHAPEDLMNKVNVSSVF